MASETATPEPEESILEDFEPEEPRRRGRVLLVLSLVLVVLGGAYVAAAWWLSDRVPRETTIAGVDVGFLPADEARALLGDAFEEIVSTPITLELGERTTTLLPSDVGLEVDVDHTIDELTGLTFHPRLFIDHITGKGDYEPVTRVDDDALRVELEAVAEALDTAPVEGAVGFADGEPDVTEPEAGQSVDIDASEELLQESWISGPRPLELVGMEVQPEIGAEAVDEALRTLARPLTTAPISVSTGDSLVELSVEDLISLASIEPQGSSLDLHLDATALAELVRERNPDLEDSGADARIVLEDGSPTIIPSESGLSLDEEELLAAVREAVVSTSDRTAEVELVETDPEFTTEDAEELGVTEVVSEFSTPFYQDADRTENLRVGARNISGTLIRPGETFSLIEALGPITAEAGYRSAGVVVDGFETSGLGGGLSQVSTTVFNAAYFAGMELVEFQPHSRHFDRYPEGRESTIYTPSVDLKWRNTTPYGALVNSWVSGDRFYVQIWGTEHFEVDSHTSDRYNFTQPRTLYNTGGGCVPNSNAQRGFTVQNTRTLSLDGEEVDRQTWTTTYVPWHRVVCGAEPSGDDSDD